MPDVVVFLHGNPAEDCETHWRAGPDFCVEVVSPNDRSRKKISFYENIGTRELLIVDRRPWRLTLLRLADAKLSVVGDSTIAERQILASAVVPVSFQLIEAEGRPAIRVQDLHDDRHWTVEARKKKR